MNVLFITNGSTNHRILELCSSFSDKLIILGNKKYEFEFGYELKQISKHKDRMKIYYAKSSLGLFRMSRLLVKKENIGLIVSHCPISTSAAIYTKFFKRNKVIFIMCQDYIEYNEESIQNPVSKYFKTLVLHLLLRVSCRFSKVVALSNHIKDRAKHYGAHNIKVIPVYGVDTSVFKSIPRVGDGLRKKYDLVGKKVIFTASRLSPEKGVDYVIRALVKIKKGVPNAMLVIAAKGPYRSFLESLVVQLNLKDSVIFMGELPKNELPSYHNMADVFVMPSFKEGLGFNALEAMACEKPVVATNVGGIKDSVIDGVTGLMVKPRDADALAQAVIHILNNPSLANALKKNGRKHVINNFEESVVSKSFVDFVLK